ncbi:MAG: hypothetical protein COB40_14555 [Marinosulfonomonas sp.]|nr:MAG: hypothetical protein COB40_14555 [Marinosulfonomonas sp.]
MHILVITLPGDDKRKLEISSQLEKQQLDFEFFDAINGRNGIPEKLNKLVDHEALKDHWRKITTTEIACALTHAFACKHIVDNISEPCIILEDDAILSEEFGELVKSGALEKSKDDLILLYHHNTRVINRPRQKLTDKHELRVPLKAPWGAVAYYVTANGAKTIYERSVPITGVADWGFDILQMKTSCIVPRIVEHPPIDQSQTTMLGRDSSAKMPDKKRRSVFAKAMDPNYRRYFFKKKKSEWIYRP